MSRRRQPPPTRQRAAPARRRAHAYTWQPSTRTQRDIATRWIPMQTPAQFIEQAAALVPRGTPWRVSLFYIPTASTSRGPSLILDFGAVTASDQRRGISTSVSVTLQPVDVPAFAAHLLSLYEFVGTIFCEVPERGGGEGEALPVPTISQTGLAMMQPAAGMM